VASGSKHPVVQWNSHIRNNSPKYPGTPALHGLSQNMALMVLFANPAHAAFIIQRPAACPHQESGAFAGGGLSS